MKSDVGTVSGFLRSVDAYSKPLEDFRVKTLFGGFLTIVALTIIGGLFISELVYYLTLEVHSELLVDTSRGEKLEIYFDIVFYKFPCKHLTLDAMDVSGAAQADIAENVRKRRVHSVNGSIMEFASEVHKVNQKKNVTMRDGGIVTTLNPKRCESCYGAETPDLRCCNTCKDVKEAYRRKGWAFHDVKRIVQCQREGVSGGGDQLEDEGCQIFGSIKVNKVAGNFHFAPGHTFQASHSHIHDMQQYSGITFNSSHLIRYLAFGMRYPGMKNPLDGSVSIDEGGSRMFQYFLKVVPTYFYHVGDSEPVISNQFSATLHTKQTGGLFSDGLPGVFISYELSPMMVKYYEKRRSFLHFLTSVCAIIGGIFAMAQMIDALFYKSSNLLKEKMDANKLG